MGEHINGQEYINELTDRAKLNLIYLFLDMKDIENYDREVMGHMLRFLRNPFIFTQFDLLQLCHTFISTFMNFPEGLQFHLEEMEKMSLNFFGKKCTEISVTEFNGDHSLRMWDFVNAVFICIIKYIISSGGVEPIVYNGLTRWRILHNDGYYDDNEVDDGYDAAINLDDYDDDDDYYDI